jgi:hypothetical protein
MSARPGAQLDLRMGQGKGFNRPSMLTSTGMESSVSQERACPGAPAKRADGRAAGTAPALPACMSWLARAKSATMAWMSSKSEGSLQ